MNYEFPIINHIDEIRDAIKSNKEFQELNRGDFIVFNYNIVGPDTFPAMNVAGGSAVMREKRLKQYSLLRECRGLIFGPDGKILSRRFHKFFNIDERPETSTKEVFNKMANMDFIILEKLDGSMVTPLVLNDGKYIRWASKRGIGTDVANETELFLLDKPQYNEFAKECYHNNVTPIFEFIAPNNRIVVSYPEGKLILLGMRNNLTGTYINYNSVKETANIRNILHVGKYYSPMSTIQQTLEYVKEQQGIEGVIILFEDGHMVKLKADWYVQIHKAKDGLRFEKDLLALIINKEIDDLMPHLLPVDKAKVEIYQQSVYYDAVLVNQRKCIGYHHELRTNGIDRKEFAIKWAGKLNPFQRYLIYKTWDYWDTNQSKIQEDILDYMLKQCSSQTNIDKLHGEIIFKKWGA